MKIVFLAICLTAGASSIAYAQSAHFVGESLVIKDGGHRIFLPDVIDPHPIARCVHAVQKRRNDYFILISVSEWTRGYPPRDGYCGSGVESSIQWLRIRDGKIAERTNGLFESCSDNRGGGITGWQDSIFIAETTDLIENRDGPAEAPARWRDITFTFDSSRPEEGIKETEVERETP